MESKLLSVMKSKYEICLFYRLYTKWWKPEIMNLQKKNKNNKTKQNNNYLNQDTRECRGLMTETCCFSAILTGLHPHPTPTPPPLPGTSFFQAVDLSMNNSSRGKVCKSILQLSTKETCCIKNGFGFDILPWKGCKCCFDVENKLKVCSLVPIVFSNSKLLDVLL